MMSTFFEMLAVDRARPSQSASDNEIAAWYLAKGRLHEHLAAEGGTDAAQEEAYAESARQHARQLLTSIAA